MRKLYSNFSKTNDLLEGNVSYFLDLIRGISAILVVMEHLSSRLLVGYGNIQNSNTVIKIIYLLNMLGNPAVIIFFVLSGLFISRSVINSLKKGTWSWKTYLINRFSRLYIVLIPALIITFILDLVASNYFSFHSYPNVKNNIEGFIGNLFFLQGIFVSQYGSNAPLWSLNYEFWYYILFPLIFILFFQSKSKLTKTIQLVLIVSIMLLIGKKMNTYFLIWLMGTLTLVLPHIKYLTGKFSAIFALFLVTGTVLIHPLVMTGRLFTHQWTPNPYILNLTISVFFSYLIYTLMHSNSKHIKNAENKMLAKLSKLLSSFSFSLYLIHYPIINAVYYWGAKNGFTGLQPNLLGILMEILLVLLICIIAFFFSRVTEAKTGIVRKFLLTKTGSLTGQLKGAVNKQKNIGLNR